MQRELQKNKMKELEVKDSIAMFSLAFRRREEQPPTEAPRDGLLSYIAQHEPCRPGQIAEDLNIPRSTLSYRLKKLVDEGKIERVGATKSRSQTYRLIRE